MILKYKAKPNDKMYLYVSKPARVYSSFNSHKLTSIDITSLSFRTIISFIGTYNYKAKRITNITITVHFAKLFH